MKPKILSIHHTEKCLFSCPHCYLKTQEGNRCPQGEIDPQEWLNLPSVAKEIGIEKIAVALNYWSPKEQMNFFADFLQRSMEQNILVDVTTVCDMAHYISIQDTALNRLKDLSGIDVFSISVDEYKTRNWRDVRRACGMANVIKSFKVGSTNANLLISKGLIPHLDSKLFSELLEYFDTVHPLLQKPFTYTHDEYYTLIEFLYKNGMFEDERVILDPCLMFRLGLVEECHSSRLIVDINPVGSVSGCAFAHDDRPIGTISKMSDLPALLENSVNQMIMKCPYLEFVDSNEIDQAQCTRLSCDKGKYSTI